MEKRVARGDCLGGLVAVRVVRHGPPTDSGAAHRERVGILGGAEEILCFSERTRPVGAIPLLGNGNEPAPTATEDSDPGTDAELEG